MLVVDRQLQSWSSLSGLDRLFKTELRIVFGHCRVTVPESSLCSFDAQGVSDDSSGQVAELVRIPFGHASGFGCSLDSLSVAPMGEAVTGLLTRISLAIRPYAIAT